MAPVLRKRKAPPPAPEPAPKKPARVAKPAPKTKAKEAVKDKPAAATKVPAAVAKVPAAAAKVPAVGDIITLDGFGGEVETNDGDKTTLKALVAESKAGVVLFTYPKASTPGCTNQVCLFRDSYEPLTAGGLAIYGLSTDSPKANTTFKTKQKLQYPLLCDPSATLIGAIGLKKSPKGTQRGVFAVDKAGKVLISEPGGPAATVNAVKALVEAEGEAEGGADAAPSEPRTDEAPADEKPAEEPKADEESKPAEEEKKDDDDTKPAEESKKDEEAQPTNGDTATEKKPEEADEKPAE